MFVLGRIPHPFSVTLAGPSIVCGVVAWARLDAESALGRTADQSTQERPL
jgi:hypothetical protein